MSLGEGEVRVKFWGVRGSIPSPGPQTARYGGNTSCVSIEGRYITDGIERVAILDAGTGIRALGQELLTDDREIILLLTHTHWDHIQGFPFFAPLYQPERKIFLSRFERERGLFRYLLRQMDGVGFPLTQDAIRSELDSYSKRWIQKQAMAGYAVRRFRTHHPGLTHGFRLELHGAVVVYVPDNELPAPDEPQTRLHRLAKFCEGADILIHDAQYLEADMPQKKGWGHSVIRDTLRLALEAKVGHLVLFHHDPNRTDAELDAIQQEAQAWLVAQGADMCCTVAYEGLELKPVS